MDMDIRKVPESEQRELYKRSTNDDVKISILSNLFLAAIELLKDVERYHGAQLLVELCARDERPPYETWIQACYTGAEANDRHFEQCGAAKIAEFSIGDFMSMIKNARSPRDVIAAVESMLGKEPKQDAKAH